MHECWLFEINISELFLLWGPNPYQATLIEYKKFEGSQRAGLQVKTLDGNPTQPKFQISVFSVLPGTLSVATRAWNSSQTFNIKNIRSVRNLAQKWKQWQY